MARKKQNNGALSSLLLAAAIDKSKPITQAPTTMRARMIEWVDGVPTLVNTQVIPKESVPDLIAAAMSAPFEDSLGLFPQYRGLTNLEVSLIRMANQSADGSLDHLNFLMNRWLGAPKATTEVKKLTMTYQDLLDAMAQDEKNKMRADDSTKNAATTLPTLED